MSVLIIAEHDNKNIKPATLSVITAAEKINRDIKVLVAGFQCANVVEQLKKINEVTEIFYVDADIYQYPLAETFAPLIAEFRDKFTHFLAVATTFGKNIMPRLAAILNVGQISDVAEIIDDCTYRRPIYAGNAFATVRALDSQQIITIRATAFAPAMSGENNAKITAIDFKINNALSFFIKEELHGSKERPELTAAEVVISGGRGLKDKETFAKLIAIADRMGAAIGASRAAVDAGLAPNDFQVGQTGQVVAPKLYIAVGISGAIQHLAGMKDSKIIVAINKDPDAPIFQIADYGLVADLQEVLPKWEKWLDEKGRDKTS